MSEGPVVVLRRRTLVLVAAVVVVLSLGGSAAVVSAGGGFSDVGSGHPFRNEILAIRDAGITTGFDDGTYRPGQPVSRGAMAAFMGRGFGRVAEGQGGAELSPSAQMGTVGSVQMASGATESGGGYVLVTGTVNFNVSAETTCPCNVGVQLTDGEVVRLLGGIVLSDDDLTPSTSSVGSVSGTAVFEIDADDLVTYSVQAVSQDSDATVLAGGNITALYVPFDGMGNVAPV